MIKPLLLFGATGDLAGRFLLPALAELYDAGHLPSQFHVVASTRQDGDDDTFRHYAAQQREQHTAPDVRSESREH